MRLFFYICIGLSIGTLLGGVAGGIRAVFFRKTYSQARVEAASRFINRVASILKYVTFLLLALGFIWCVFFLVLGIIMPQQADYANNMAELVVAVLSVVSILFAFVEFLKRKDQ